MKGDRLCLRQEDPVGKRDFRDSLRIDGEWLRESVATKSTTTLHHTNLSKDIYALGFKIAQMTMLYLQPKGYSSRRYITYSSYS